MSAVAVKSVEALLKSVIGSDYWTISLVSFSMFDAGYYHVEGKAGNRECCDKANTHRHCAEEIEFDPKTGHGYSHFDSRILHDTSMAGFSNLLKALEWAESAMKSAEWGAPRFNRSQWHGLL